MLHIYQKLFLFVSILFFSIAQGQTIEGHVYDETTKEPLYGVAVYFDGTTNGTATDMEGFFTLSYKPSIKSPLVVSYLGYHTKTFNIKKLDNNVKIYLKPKEESLDVVYLENDPWTRKKKMRIFRKEFLGRSILPEQCKIMNEKDIEVTYSPTTNILKAYASKPIKIKNKYLGYTISYTMETFEAKLHIPPSGIVLTENVYVEGTSFYKERHKRLRNRHKKAREKEYKQSVLYFMRSLAAEKLEENGFQIFHKQFIVPPYKYFEILKKGEDTHVNLTTDRLVIVFDRFHKSVLTIKEENKAFVINKYGNYAPPRKLFFGGVMGGKRIAKTLPLDYNPE